MSFLRSFRRVSPLLNRLPVFTQPTLIYAKRITLASVLFGSIVHNSWNVNCSPTIDINLGSSDEFQEGISVKKELPTSGNILVVRIKGKLYAIGSECSHFGFDLSKGLVINNENPCVTCPLHQAQFNLETGESLSGPTFTGIPTFPIYEKDNQVFITLTLPSENDIESLPVKYPNKVRVTPKYVERDTNNNRLFLIIGSGAAAASAAEELRIRGYDGKICVFTKDKYLPYNKCSLNKLGSAITSINGIQNQVSLWSQEKAEKLDIIFVPETEVISIDSEKNTVLVRHNKPLPASISSTSNSTESIVKFDKALIATGVSGKDLLTAGSHLKGVFQLRSADQFNKIAEYIDNLKKDSRIPNVVLVGGGFIVTEFSDTLAKVMEPATTTEQAGVNLYHIYPDQFFLQKIAGSRIASGITRKIKLHMGEFRPCSEVTGIIGDQAVSGVRLQTNEVLPADIVIYSVGSYCDPPEIKGAQFAKDGSILVDKYLSISPDVYAAGDIVTYPSAIGGVERCEHWCVASNMGRAAARNMMGKQNEYKATPFFWSKMSWGGFQVAGRPSDDLDIVYEGNVEELDFIAYYIDQDKVKGVLTFGK